MSEERIAKINEVITNYFDANAGVNWIAAKDLMPDLIKAGIFYKDIRKGLPLREVLRALDEEKALDKIPFVHAVRNEKNTYWYLVRKGAEYLPAQTIEPVSKKNKGIHFRENNDEYYIINLFGELLNERASRQHKFDFLLGDLHKDGKTRTELPVDAYYPNSNLVIEFSEKQHSESADTFDKQDKITISGVNRAKQRELYAQRKRDVLSQKNIQLLELAYTAFECDDNDKLMRDKEKVVKILEGMLKGFILKEGGLYTSS